MRVPVLLLALSTFLAAPAFAQQPSTMKPEETEGFKVGEKKTIEEYHKLGMYHATSLI